MKSRIAKLCSERGMSAYRLSKEAGISRSVLTKWERVGIYRAQFGSILRVARALEVSVEDLYESEGM